MPIPPSFLKYLSPDRIDCLKSGLIRFTQPSELNDPFELSPAITHLTAEAFSPSYTYTIEDLIDEDYIFSESRFHKLEKVEATYRKATEQLGILSLTSTQHISQIPSVEDIGPDDPRMNLAMWAHYAASHTGFIIEFYPDFIEDLNIREVKYQNHREILTIEEAAELDDSIFFQKSPHWKYENEWRAIKPLAEAKKIINDNVHLFEFKKHKIKNITLGCRMSRENINKIRDIMKAYPVYHGKPLLLSRLNKQSHTLDFDTEIISSTSHLTNNMFGISHEPVHVQKMPERFRRKS